MSLTPGTRLGPYEVTAQIGVGGMGEVYRATDTNLRRDVAIKVLPEAVAADPERLARFQREAQVLAALNHPNIAQIHGVEKSDGMTALVMELVEGPTLDDLIRSEQPDGERVSASRRDSDVRPARGGGAPRGLNIDVALPIAKQIADAIEAAHEQNIIHRDLKPANIKVRVDGTVKVLDFGLAKALDPASAQGASAGQALSQSPTITSPAMTQMGMILGTAAYMSPEQAKGRPVDKRADIWAFGAVLYEMLTGRRAFGGDDISETLADVMRVEPTWTSLPDGLPASLVTFLKRCLTKDPRQRLGDIHDMRLALDGAFETALVTATPDLPRRRWSAARLVAVGAGAVLVGALGTLAWMGLTRVPASSDQVRQASIELTTIGGVPISVAEDASSGGNVRPSLDAAGRLLVVSGHTEDGVWRLFKRPLDQTDADPIPGTESADQSALSPDGAWLAFVANQELRVIALAGGGPQDLQPMPPEAPPGIAWVGTESVIVGGPEGLVRVPVGGGPVERVTSVNANAGEIDHRWPSVTADGATLAYNVWMGSGTTAQVRLRSLSNGQEYTITQGQSPVLTATGYLVFGRGDAALWAQSIDRRTLQATGEAKPVLDGVGNRVNGLSLFAVSDDGVLVYGRRIERAVPAELLDRTGTVIGSVGEAFAGVVHAPPRFSPDGTRVASTRHPTAGRDQIIVYDLRRPGDKGIALAGAGDSRWPVWTPDGTRLTFFSTRNGDADLFEVPADLSAEAQPLLVRSGDQAPSSWTPDGKTLAFTTGPDSNLDIWLLPRGGEPSPLLTTASAMEGFPVFSSDGKWLAYVTNEGGRLDVYLRGYPTADRRYRISAATGGGAWPAWARDGLYYESGGDVYFVAMPAGSSPPATIAPQRLVHVGISSSLAGWDVSPDGRTFVVVKDPSAGGSSNSLGLVVNWFEELKRLVPTP